MTMTMTFDEVMAALEAVGTEQTRRTYLRHGAREPLFGVKFGLLRPLAKRIGRDHDLAQRLRRSGNSDARLLACMVADPERTTEVELDAWLADIDTYFLVDTFVAELASKAPGRRERAGRWIASEQDRTAQAGWDLLNAEAPSRRRRPIVCGRRRSEPRRPAPEPRRRLVRTHGGRGVNPGRPMPWTSP